MAGFVSDLVEDKTTSLNMESLRVHVTKAVHDYKAAVVLFHDKPETLLSYRVIAQNEQFEKYFTFANYKNPPDDIVQSTPQQKLPSLILYYSSFNPDEEVDLKANPIRMAFYQGNILYTEMFKFFDEFVKTQIQPKIQHQESNVQNLQYQKELDNCKNNVFCVIALIDNDAAIRKPGDTSVHLPQQDFTGILRRLKDVHKVDNVDIWYLDAICHHDLILDFGLEVSEDVPSVLVMWWYKKEFAVMNGTYTYTDIDLFIKRAKRRAVNIQKLPKDWKMHSRNK